MPFARRVFAIAAASMLSSKSIVATTGERCAASVTKGVATDDASAQSYSTEDDSDVRAAAQASPPLSRIQRSWLSSRCSVVSAGVLSVWLSRELSTAFFRLRNSGMYRPDAAMRSMRSIAAGETAANHRPPSEPRFFCGAK